MYKDGAYVGDGSKSSSFSYTFSGLEAGTSYNLSVQWFTGTNGATELGTNSTGSVSTNLIRPSNFSWSYSNVYSGSDAIVNSQDWNALTNRINAFRAYKGLGNYGFSTVYSSTGDITASLFNQLVNGANGLAAYMSYNVMPSTKNSGDSFYAAYLNNIVTSINSIS